MAPTAACAATNEAGSGLRAQEMKPPDWSEAVRRTLAVWRTVPRVTTSRYRFSARLPPATACTVS